MNNKASGSFEVDLRPLPCHCDDAQAELGHLSIDKQFQGDLDATSCGQMLSAGSPAKGSAGYVAIERVTGSLHGKRGSFTLQHSATITRGDAAMNIIVVPDSGTDELAGLSGSMKIIIEGGKHSYEFDYGLPD